jgi:hypothetical protein
VVTSSTNVTITLHTPSLGAWASEINANDAGMTVAAAAGQKIVSHGAYYQSAACSQKGMYAELRGSSATNWVWFGQTNGWTFTP